MKHVDCKHHLVVTLCVLCALTLGWGCGDPSDESTGDGPLVMFDTEMETGQGNMANPPAMNLPMTENTDESEDIDVPTDLERETPSGEPPQPEDMEMLEDVDNEMTAKACTGSADEGHLYSMSANSFTRGESVPMCEFEGKAVLFVNTAANCGFTPQLEALEGLHRDYRDRPLVVLGFLTNDFGNQGGSLEEVEQCTSQYMVSFEQFLHIGVLAESRVGQDPIYAWLTSQPGFVGPIEWNFNKILVSHEGEVIGRWNQRTAPNDPSFLAAIEAAVSAAPLALDGE